ncbi:MAG: hypothetical protein IJX77_10395 [Ruminococcus sp.]|nr:hypothetical protein [Ruminococcus sp.]
MSWINPTPDEAADGYYASKRKYSEAASQRYASQRAEEGYRAERSRTLGAIASCASDKINFERRIEDLEKIIGMMQGTGGFFSEDVPGAISTANSSLAQADNSYRSCIKCDSLAAPDMTDIFRNKAVEEEQNSASALQGFISEKARLEQAVIELQAQINALSAAVDTLSQQIRSCNAEQASLSKIMAGSAYDISHYRRYM